jgi:selenocysteine lyase/cysteine desulfurase
MGLLVVLLVCASLGAAQATAATAFGHAFKSKYFFIEPGLTPLNHGAFGATPRPVMQAQLAYMEKMEASCDAWFHQGLAFDLLNQTRHAVAAFVGSNVSNLVLVDNASAACNAALRSLKLGPTDIIMLLSWEYPLGVTVSDYVSQITGARIVTLNMSFPTDEDTIVAEFEAGLAKYRPRVAFFDAIASYPAFVMPTSRLVQLTRQYNAISIVDGAHAIGQIPLNLEELDPDFYFANGYKWLCSPKGSALLRVSPRMQAVTWPATINNGDPDFATRFWWTGTRDYSAWFAFLDTIEFRKQAGGEAAWTGYNNGLCTSVFELLSKRWNVSRAVPPSMTASLLTMPLPCGENNTRCPFAAFAVEAFMRQHDLQVVTLDFNGGKYVRFSCQVYNEISDYVRFADLLDEFFKQQEQQK